MKQQLNIALFLTVFYYVSIRTKTNIILTTSIHVHGFSISPPVMGIGALLLKPRNTIIPSEGDDDVLFNAAKCFTDAFWNGKTGGVKELSPKQSMTLTKQQITEFRRRYGFKMGSTKTKNNKNDRRAELVVCQSKSSGEIMGCAGIEVTNVSTPNGKSAKFAAPLMSNLAVGKKFRRRGLAEDLVKATEQLARKEWGYDECYLFVEKKNTSAVKLYRKLGYSQQWEDDTATTLVPTARGSVVSAPTVIVCMRKKLGGGLFGQFR